MNSPYQATLADIVNTPAAYDTLKGVMDVKWLKVGRRQPRLRDFMPSVQNVTRDSNMVFTNTSGGATAKDWIWTTALVPDDAVYSKRQAPYKDYYLAERMRGNMSPDTFMNMQDSMIDRFAKEADYKDGVAQLAGIFANANQIVKRDWGGDEARGAPITVDVTKEQDGWQEYSLPLGTGGASAPETQYKTKENFMTIFKKTDCKQTQIGNDPAFTPGAGNLVIVDGEWMGDFLEFLNETTNTLTPVNTMDIYNPQLTAARGENSHESIIQGLRIRGTAWTFLQYIERDIFGAPNILWSQALTDPEAPTYWRYPVAILGKRGCWYTGKSVQSGFRMEEKNYLESGQIIASIIEGGATMRVESKAQGVVWGRKAKTTTQEINFFALQLDNPNLDPDQVDKYYRDYVGKTPEGKDLMASHKRAIQGYNEENKRLSDIMRAPVTTTKLP